MQSEEEKYYLINQLLKGKLSENESNALAELYSSDSFAKEVEMHRLANEAIEENYLIGIRASTKKVIKKNSLWNSLRWTAGLAVLATGITLYYLYTSPEIKSAHEALPEKISLNQTKIQLTETAKPSLKNQSTIKPNKNGQTAHKSIAAESPETVQQPGFSMAPHKEEKNIIENKKTESLEVTKELVVQEEKIQALSPAKEKVALKPLIELKNEQSEFVLNPDLNEKVSFPIDEGFNGELAVFDANGNLVVSLPIRDGLPNEWDGRHPSGGSIPSGQYGFIIKTIKGKEIKQGFVTIVR